MAFVSLQASAYYTHPLSDDVKTLQVIADGDFQKLPVIDNSGNSFLEISFDILSDEELFLQYQVIHCDAQWEQDNLSELDYVNGFQPTEVTAVSPSFNTYINYWHYSVAFPNEDVELLVSGNYAVIFHLQSDPDAQVAVACFSVTEQMAFVGGTVSGGSVTVNVDETGTKWRTAQCVLKSDAAITASFVKGEGLSRVELRNNDTELWATPKVSGLSIIIQ